MLTMRFSIRSVTFIFQERKKTVLPQAVTILQYFVKAAFRWWSSLMVMINPLFKCLDCVILNCTKLGTALTTFQFLFVECVSHTARRVLTVIGIPDLIIHLDRPFVVFNRDSFVFKNAGSAKK